MTKIHSLIIGAGIGGLTTAALLLRAGHQVTVLEAHLYPGGSAGTFFHKGYRFDAGATLAGGFAPGGPHARLAEQLGLSWPVQPVDPAWVVHLPDGRSVTQWADPHRWQAERQRVFPGTEPFWQKLELLADLAWDVSSRPFPWPPQSAADLAQLTAAIRPRTLRALPYLTRTIGDLAPAGDPLLRAFIDAQLLISAQTTADHANALYGSAAFDLPRRGVNHVRGGIGALAQTLVNWIRSNGGEVHFRQQVEKIRITGGRATAVHTKKNRTFTADNIIANLTPWALADLLGDAAPRRLRRQLGREKPTWGAFTLYLGVAADRLPAGIADHHQVIVDHHKPLGEGNSVFVSLTEPGEPERAPAGMRAVTISTHTAVAPWWQLRHGDKATYHALRDRYTEKLLRGAEIALPGISAARELTLPGTPVTFEYYTRRPFGMVGGFPQESIFRARGPKTGLPNLWLVGDSIFPGQSTAGVTLGGMRVADAVQRASRRPLWQTAVQPPVTQTRTGESHG